MQECEEFNLNDYSPSDNDDTPEISTNRAINRYNFPTYSGVTVLIVLGVFYAAVYFIDNSLPTPLTIVDEKSFPDSFIAERAIGDLRSLTNIGQRITGGKENEVLAVDFLKREINLIIAHSHPNQKIQLDVQVVSGAYNIDLINAYSNIQNVVVKLFGKNESTSSVLVNSHFDSVPTSPGGSDDGINVAVMLEVLRKLSRSSDRQQHSIIFLFNGAEETPLQASHGFITQHMWAKECKVVVNLEACGAGGKIILFQTGPGTPWLVDYYSKVPYPYGQAAGEEIFQAGLIPSGTDFRIFRDFGSLVGLDMAFYKQGYRYHTKYDDFEHIPNGSYQHAGANSLNLIKNLANAAELKDDVPSPGKKVYFDVLGWFMVSYSTLIAAILNCLVVVLSLAACMCSIVDFKLMRDKRTLGYITVVFLAILGGWLLSLLFINLIAFIFDLAGRTMSWFTNTWLIVGLYVVPTVALSGCLLFFVKSKKISTNFQCFTQIHLVRLIWTVILFIGTILNIRSMYYLSAPVLFNSLGLIIIYAAKWQQTSVKWLLVYLASLIIPTIFLMYGMLTVMALFIPITGRMGPNRNPDTIIGILIFFFTMLIISPYVAVVTLIRNAKYFFEILAGIFLIFFIMAFTPLGFPYRGNPDSPTPQRQWMIHTKRVFHDEQGVVNDTNSGIFLLNMDRNSPNILKSYVKDLENALPLEADCLKYPLCGVPLSHPKMTMVIKYGSWIPAVDPELPQPLVFKTNSREQINSTLIKYNVTIKGPDRLAVYLVPKMDMKVTEISLLDSLKPSKYLYNGREVYFILHTYGKEPADLDFSFSVNVPPGYNGTTVDLAVNAWYVHEKKFVKTPYYSDMLKQFPDWADLTAWLGTYDLYFL